MKAICILSVSVALGFKLEQYSAYMEPAEGDYVNEKILEDRAMEA